MFVEGGAAGGNTDQLAAELVKGTHSAEQVGRDGDLGFGLFWVIMCCENSWR